MLEWIRVWLTKLQLSLMSLRIRQLVTFVTGGATHSEPLRHTGLVMEKAGNWREGGEGKLSGGC